MKLIDMIQAKTDARTIAPLLSSPRTVAEIEELTGLDHRRVRRAVRELLATEDAIRRGYSFVLKETP